MGVPNPARDIEIGQAEAYRAVVIFFHSPAAPAYLLVANLDASSASGINQMNANIALIQGNLNVAPIQGNIAQIQGNIAQTQAVLLQKH